MRLKHFVYLFLLLTWVQSALAAQMAVVSTSRAVVYADQALSSPIGYIRQGRRLMVGTVARNRGTVLPIVVAGKVAYIQMRDVTLSDQYAEALDGQQQGPRELEHMVEEFTDDSKFQYDFTENNYVILGQTIVAPGSTLDSINQDENLETKNFTNWTLTFEHRPIISRYSFGVGLTYFSLDQGAYRVQSLSAEGHIYYSLLRFRFISLEALGGLSLSGDFRFSDEFDQQRGGLFGYHLGAQVRLAPRSKLGGVAQVGLKSLRPIGIEEVYSDSPRELSSFGGVYFFAGLAYKL